MHRLILLPNATSPWAAELVRRKGSTPANDPCPTMEIRRSWRRPATAKSSNGKPSHRSPLTRTTGWNTEGDARHAMYSYARPEAHFSPRQPLASYFRLESPGRNTSPSPPPLVEVECAARAGIAPAVSWHARYGREPVWGLEPAAPYHQAAEGYSAFSRAVASPPCIEAAPTSGAGAARDAALGADGAGFRGSSTTLQGGRLSQVNTRSGTAQSPRRGLPRDFDSLAHGYHQLPAGKSLLRVPGQSHLSYC